MSNYKKDREEINNRLAALPDASIDRQRVQAELDLFDTDELRRQAKKVGIDLDLDNPAGVGPWESHPDNPQIRWLPARRHRDAIRVIEAARSARRKQRRDLIIKLAPIVIALLALLVSLLAYFRPVTH
jgi:hypothetical protein